MARESCLQMQAASLMLHGAVVAARGQADKILGAYRKSLREAYEC
jgi:hypothetical protein